MADELFTRDEQYDLPTPDKVVGHFRSLKAECADTYQFEAAMQLEMMARTVEKLTRQHAAALLELNELKAGVKVVLPTSREHAEAMSLVASHYLERLDRNNTPGPTYEAKTAQ